MKVLVDTNVVLAAMATRGVGAELFEYLCVHHEVLLAEFVLDEVSEKLRKKFRVPDGLVDLRMAWLREQGRIVAAVQPDASWCRDADDDNVIAAALAADAAAILTGDADLLVLGKVQGVAMVAPRDWYRFEAMPRLVG